MDHRSPRPPATLGRQLRTLGVLLLVVAVLVGGGWGIFYLTVGGPVLKGEHDHDFGLVMLSGEDVLLRHTFVLSNGSRRPIEVDSVRTTCRCTVVALDTPRTVAPGETLEVNASLGVSSEGRKEAKIHMLCDGEIETLRLTAVARKKQRLVLPRAIALEPGERVERTLIYYDYDTNDTPLPVNIVSSPEGVGVEIGEWTIQTRRSSAKGFPARWSMRFAVTQDAEAISVNAVIVLEVTDQRLTVPLAGPPDFPATAPGFSPPNG
jgi:hypothetical protein